MRIVQRNEWSGTAEELAAAVSAFRAELEAHRYTEGVPAPWPASDLIGDLARSDEDFELAPQSDPMTEPDLLAAMHAIVLERAAQPKPPAAVTAYVEATAAKANAQPA